MPPRFLLALLLGLLIAGCPSPGNDDDAANDDDLANDDDATANDDDDDDDDDATPDPLDVDDDGDGVTENQGDCDDDDPANFPGNPEVCDGQDNDCNPGAGFPGEFTDADKDGSLACADCDDADASLGDQASDQDCDGTPAISDCDDLDPESTNRVEDNDCDGTVTAYDCDDSDPTSTVLMSDPDCDGTVCTSEMSGGFIEIIQTGGWWDNLTGVVTGIALDDSGAGVALFVQTWGCNPWTGIHVVATGAEQFAVGDAVFVAGEPEEYDANGAWPASVTRFVNTINLQLSGSPHAPVVAAVVPQEDLLDPATAEQWEGVLVTVLDVTVDDYDPFTDEWTATSGLAFADTLGAYGFQFGAGDTFTSITGVVDYSVDSYKVLPRGPADFVGHVATTSCALAPGDVVITELLRDPTEITTSESPQEWLEIKQVLNGNGHPLTGCQLRDTFGNSHVIGSLYLWSTRVLGGTIDTADNGGAPVEYAWGTDIELANGPGGIAIGLPGGTPVDVVMWDDGTTFPSGEGASMRLDWDYQDPISNDDGANWCPGTVPFGTAGDLGDPWYTSHVCPN